MPRQYRLHSKTIHWQGLTGVGFVLLEMEWLAISETVVASWMLIAIMPQNAQDKSTHLFKPSLFAFHSLNFILSTLAYTSKHIDLKLLERRTGILKLTLSCDMSIDFYLVLYWECAKGEVTLFEGDDNLSKDKKYQLE